jgi:hypothetical protein
MEDQEIKEQIASLISQMMQEGGTSLNLPLNIIKTIDNVSSLLLEIKDNNKRLDSEILTLFHIPNVALKGIGATKKDILTVGISNLGYGNTLLDVYRHIFKKLDSIALNVDEKSNLKYQEKKQEFETWAERIDPKSGCYIATMAYGDYEHPQVIELRKFRDNTLKKSSLGRSFIKFYYKYSPKLVEILKNKSKTNNTIRIILDAFVKKIKR